MSCRDFASVKRSIIGQWLGFDWFGLASPQSVNDCLAVG